METITGLINLLNSLPKGNVYQKNIYGRKYFYHQYFDNGQKITTLIPNSEISKTKKLVNQRKEIEQKIKTLERSTVSVQHLSKMALELTGDVMSGDIIVATFDHGNLVSIDEQFAPLIIKRTHSLEAFLKTRMIDTSRVNSRLLKEAMGINMDKDYLLPLYSYARSITDNYWFKPKHSKVKIQDLSFNNDNFFDVSLKGDTSYSPKRSILTPELTTTGSYEKGWRKLNNYWWLYKKGNGDEIFSELFCYQFARLIGQPTATYVYDNGYIRTPNFTSFYMFEPMEAIAGDDDNYETVFAAIKKVKEELLPEYIKLMFFDAVINNVDRHNQNCGIMRCVLTGEIDSLAPNFDNNLALVAGQSLKENPTQDGLIKLFESFIKTNKEAHRIYESLYLPDIKEKDIDNIFRSIPIYREDAQTIKKAVLARYNYLKNL